MNQYFKDLDTKVKVSYSVAQEARAKGLDPVSLVEIPTANSLAERVTGLVSVKYPQVKGKEIEKRIKELEEQYGVLDHAVCLQIAEEVAKEKFCKFQNLHEAMDAGIRIAFAYITLGVVSSPLEGYVEFRLKKTKDNKDYVAAYYSGPIRSAGGTGSAFSVLIIDHLREVLGYARYDPNEKEIKRAVTEVYDYHERITNLQYLPSEEEIKCIASNIPIQIDGDPSEDKEVSNYKDLERIETNFLRNGFCLVFAEGLASKGPKILKIINNLRKKGFKLSDWDWFEGFVNLQREQIKKKVEKATGTYISDIVAGRPILGHPSKPGSFRLRYGRARNSGYSAVAISPATMSVLENFVAIGTQLKLEKPTKGAAIATCDSIEGPIIKLKDGSVLQVKSFDEGIRLKEKIKEIIYLGDILISYGDFVNRNHLLLPAGYNEEWWLAELKKKQMGVPSEINIEKAIELSKEFSIPLHPKFILFWTQISVEELIELLKWLLIARVDDKIILPYYKSEQEKMTIAKRALEILGIPHLVSTEDIIMNAEDSKVLLSNLGIGFYLAQQDQDIFHKKIKEVKEKTEQMFKDGERDMMFFINTFSKIKIKDKAGTFIGARMGRPEKAKLRKLTGSPHVLFPVGEEGGRMRSVKEAAETTSVKADFPIYFCDNCKKETIYYICEDCGEKCKKMNYCPLCERVVTDICPEHGGLEGKKIKNYMHRRIDISHYIKAAIKNLGITKEEVPVLIKGVRGTSSESHTPENLVKGIIRAKYNLNVNKDGTIRYDATELPLTHFKPKEIRVGFEDLKRLGYKQDIHNKELTNDDQILELKPHDIILPSSPESTDDPADKVFISICKFIDELLVKFYKLKPFYNVKTSEDLLGHLVVCIAPHNAAGVIGRIIGFSKTQTLLASPYMHAAMRRDCDGDEAAILLLLDTLINFSREYLPAHRGSTQDAPLLLNTRIRAGEVDDMIFDLDIFSEFPSNFYEAAETSMHPTSVKLEQVKDRLKDEKETTFENLGYTHETSDINLGTLCSSYKTLVTMQEKVQKQMEVAEKVRAVDRDDVARLVIERHFIRDIKGNLRKFSMQQFRCVSCNSKYRRPPLIGKCLKCNGKIIFTISEGSIIKYLEPALQLAERYNVSNYIKQSLILTKSYIESIFGREQEKQESIAKWF